MHLKIVQAGHPTLRRRSRPLEAGEIRNAGIQQLIDFMRETMRDAPGVGLAAPQVGLPVQIAVIEDRAELLAGMPPEVLAERQRVPVPFQVLINPQIELTGGTADFFEGCLSLTGFSAIVPRALEVRVTCLDHRGESQTFATCGWHARIVQHEVDHLRGTLYIDRMRPRTFTTNDHLKTYWSGRHIAAILDELELPF